MMYVTNLVLSSFSILSCHKSYSISRISKVANSFAEYMGRARPRSEIISSGGGAGITRLKSHSSRDVKVGSFLLKVTLPFCNFDFTFLFYVFRVPIDFQWRSGVCDDIDGKMRAPDVFLRHAPFQSLLRYYY